MSYEYDGYEWVQPETSGRRGGYWRRIPSNRNSPTEAQIHHRIRFGEAAGTTRGLNGVELLPDGREVSRSAITLGNMMREMPEQDQVFENRFASISGHNGIPEPKVSPIEALPKPSPSQDLFDLVTLYKALQQPAMPASENDARFTYELKRFRAEQEEAREKFQRFLEVQTQKVHKILEPERKPPPALRMNAPAISKPQLPLPPLLPVVEPHDPESEPMPEASQDDINPWKFLGGALLGIGAVGLLAWGLKSKDNMAVVVDVLGGIRNAMKASRS